MTSINVIINYLFCSDLEKEKKIIILFHAALMSKPPLSQKGESDMWNISPEPKSSLVSDLAVILLYGNIRLLPPYGNFMSHLIAGSFIENVYRSSQKINAG